MIEKITEEYINKYGFLFKNDTLILLEDLKLEEKINSIKEKYKKKRKQLLQNREKAIEELKDYGERVGEDVADEVNDILAEKIRKLKLLYMIKLKNLKKNELEELMKVKKLIKKSTLIISGIAFASLSIYTAYKIYRDAIKRYEKKCENDTGEKKRKCVLELKIKALKRRLTFLNNAAINCNYSKDPINCRKKLDQEILKVRELIRNFSNEVITRLTGED